METLQVWSACLRLGSLVFRTCGSTTSCPCVASLIMQNSISLVLLLGSEFTQLTHTSGCGVCPQAFSTWDLLSAWKPSWVASIQFHALASLYQLFSHIIFLFFTVVVCSVSLLVSLLVYSEGFLSGFAQLNLRPTVLKLVDDRDV